VNCALTAVSAASVSEQGAMPEHAPPLQPVNRHPAAAVAVSAMPVPGGNEAEQAVVHVVIPAGALVTEPRPWIPTESFRAFANVAVVAWSLAMERVQTGAVPAQPPLQPTNSESAAGVAVSVTAAPDGNEAAHVDPQAISPPPLETVPVPSPALLTVSPRTAVNVTPSDAVPTGVVVQVAPWPAQIPLQLANLEPELGVAVSVMAVPFVTSALHAEVQEMPPVTFPEPLSERFTRASVVNVTGDPVARAALQPITYA
jgi:hypothetical protein